MPINDTVLRAAALSSALAPIWRGRFCDTLLPGRATTTFDREEVVYELGDKERNLFFIQNGLVKVGTIINSGREIIYDIRKDGDVVGELSCFETSRRDRAVAIERTEAVTVPFTEAMHVMAQYPALLQDFIEACGRALSEAYDQVNRLADGSVERGLVEVLQSLAEKLGHPAGQFVEIGAYLTQEELSQMVVARRERVSTALNSLRRRGIVQYSARGFLLIDTSALESYNSPSL
jgi:CRP/FNR family transcriptional regulator, cyclic AMP receptor protein